MTTATLAKYVIANKQIEKLEDDAKENEWVVTLDKEKEQTLKYPEQCISVYYRLDTENKQVKERLCMTSYHKKYEQAFKDISIGWLEEYFSVEDVDLIQLNNQHELIIKPGGEIFTLLNEKEQVVGVTAMIDVEDHAELGKMGVKKGFSGNGYANPLMFEAINWAKARIQKYSHVGIHTASKLTPAVTLYKKFGFYNVPLEAAPHKRTDTQMKLDL